MHLLDLPLEIRHRIYSETLVKDDPIKFDVGKGAYNSRFYHWGSLGLTPALLRINKTVNREASPFLYSNNRFWFPDAYDPFNTAPYSAVYDSRKEMPCIAAFLQQIGTNSRLLRHIRINFPTSFALTGEDQPVLREDYARILQLIRESCLDLRTVELSCNSRQIFSLHDMDEAVEILRVLDDGGFNFMQSLEEIVVVYGEYDIDSEVTALRERLMQRMPSHKWSIRIELMKRAVPRNVWLSDEAFMKVDENGNWCS